MPLKTHLLILSCIIFAVFVSWQVMRHLRVETPVEESKTAIQLVRASWGLNCSSKLFHGTAREAQTGDYTFDNQKHGGIYPDNARGLIVGACEGAVSCQINLNLLGPDPAPECGEKEMVVEYRCYAFDRLRRLVIPPHQVAKLDCAGVAVE